VLRPFAVRNRRAVATLGLVLAALVGVNLAVNLGPLHTGLVVGPAVAVVLVVLARRAGLTWDDLGLARRSWRRGALYAGLAIVSVAVVYATAVALPVTRLAFLDVRYRFQLGHALVSALVIIPLSTVLIEEIAFRGVLLGLVKRHRGMVWASTSSSVLFGLWHILPSLGLGGANKAIVAVFGAGSGVKFLVVVAAVAFTALAGVLLCEMRRRSGSLLAAAGLHWATNALGVLLAAAVWSLRAF